MPTPGMPGESKRSDSRATQLRADFHQNGRRMSARGFGAAGEASETASEAPAGGGVRKAGLQDGASSRPHADEAGGPRPAVPCSRRGDGGRLRAQMARTGDKPRMVRRCPRLLSGGASIETRTSALGAARSSQHSRQAPLPRCGVFCNSCSRWLKSLPSWVMMTPCACVGTASTKARA